MYASTFRQFFMWCTVINFVMLLFSAVFLMFYADKAYKMHSRFFKISRDMFDTVIYCFIGLYKIFWFVFCVIPWIALCIIS